MDLAGVFARPKARQTRGRRPVETEGWQGGKRSDGTGSSRARRATGSRRSLGLAGGAAPKRNEQFLGWQPLPRHFVQQRWFRRTGVHAARICGCRAPQFSRSAYWASLRSKPRQSATL